MHNEVDPFEEFEFKPITDGLGFHRSQKTLNESTSQDRTAQESENSSPLFSKPLPNRKTATKTNLESFSTRESLAQSQTHDIVDEILKNIESSKQKASAAQFELPQAPQPKVITSKVESVYKSSGPLLTAMFLDLMLVVASTLLFLVALLAITKIDLLMNIKNPDDQGSVYISLFLLFCSVGFTYYVCFRCFLGYTPGEWAYDQKIQMPGGKLDFLNLTKIALRSVLVLVTGGIVIPLVSWVFDKDFLGNFLELPLVRRK